MRKKYKIGLIIIALLNILVSIIGIMKLFIKEEKPQNKSEVISNIKDYGYTLDDRDTKYMKEVFNELELVLNEDKVNMEEYAKCLAKLFVIDFYTLNNKFNRFDVGSLEYIYSSKLEEFRLKAVDTIYKDIIDNTYKDRIQDLPQINNVTVNSVELTTYKVGEDELEAYKLTLSYQYEEDMGYDKEGTLFLAVVENKLEVVNYLPSIEE